MFSIMILFTVFYGLANSIQSKPLAQEGSDTKSNELHLISRLVENTSFTSCEIATILVGVEK